MDFNMATYPEDARVQKAVLALHVQNNIPFFAQTVQIRGRMMTGDVLQSIGQYPILPSVQPGWILFDVTAIAARAINERRPALHIEVSLPCGRSDSELTIMSLTEAEPRLIVEFR
jgi:hypothetical protein